MSGNRTLITLNKKCKKFTWVWQWGCNFFKCTASHCENCIWEEIAFPVPGSRLGTSLLMNDLKTARCTWTHLLNSSSMHIQDEEQYMQDLQNPGYMIQWPVTFAFAKLNPLNLKLVQIICKYSACTSQRTQHVTITKISL
jgi:hypothetical protein